MPPNIDYSAIREALARRASGGLTPNRPMPPAPPAINQVAPAGGVLPTGGANSPISAPPQSPNPSSPPQGNLPPRQAIAGMAKVGQTAQSPLFDQQTRDLSKALVKKLLEYI